MLDTVSSTFKPYFKDVLKSYLWEINKKNLLLTAFIFNFYLEYIFI